MNYKQKYIIPLLFLILILSGCSSHSDATKSKVTQKVTNYKKMDTEYKQIVEAAQQKREEQEKNLQNTPKEYGGVTNCYVFKEPTKVKQLETNKSGINPAIVLSGVVTEWKKAPHGSDGRTMTDLEIRINRQFTFKKSTNLESETITVRQPGGYTTREEQPVYGATDELTEEQKKEIVFVEDSEISLPKLGEQILVVVTPMESDDFTKFTKHKKFDKNTLFHLAVGPYWEFYFDKEAHKYVLNKSSQTTDTASPLLDDINKNYLEGVVE